MGVLRGHEQKAEVGCSFFGNESPASHPPPSKGVWTKVHHSSVYKVNIPTKSISMKLLLLFSFISTTIAAVNVTFCWKSSYFRGIGFPPNHCGSKEKSGLLCHEPCKETFTGAGLICWKDCPQGYRNQGLFCRKEKTLKFTKRVHYSRGIGELMKCPPYHDYEGGLCHPKCNSGYAGVGPICWQRCSMNFTNSCVAGCSNSGFGCAFAAVDMTYASSWLMMNIVTIGKSMSKQTQFSKLVKGSELSPQILKSHTDQVVNLLQRDGGLGLGMAESVAENIVNRAYNQQSTIDWTMLDPTGVAAVVKAFMKPICRFES